MANPAPSAAPPHPILPPPTLVSITSAPPSTLIIPFPISPFTVVSILASEDTTISNFPGPFMVITGVRPAAIGDFVPSPLSFSIIFHVPPIVYVPSLVSKKF